MLDSARPFTESMALTVPYLRARTVGGALMVLGHLVFVWHFGRVILIRKVTGEQPALFSPI
jgi:cytochrome c oxidase cbb3-type subunit 1